MKQPVFLVFSQVYVPDPAAVGQHIADAAAEMARRGYRTIVYTARHGYEDSDVEYPAREVKDGVEIRRLPWSSFGKGSVKVRLIAQILFLLQAMIRGLFIPRLCGVLVSTSPPACGIGGAIISLVRRVPLKFWVMDLNPDQLVVMKVLRATSWPVKLFEAFNLATLWKCSDVVVLDRFMGERVQRKHPVAHKMQVLPPWPLDERVQDMPHGDNAFRQQYVRDGKFVVMYSGNHTPANPLKTLLDAAETMQDEPRLQVMCIGGGGAKKEVDDKIAAGVKNIVSLPYQPVHALSQSLSAADLHVVAMGDDMVGIVHPCKVYGAMSVSRPVLFFGPAESHIGALLHAHQFGWRVDHGDIAGAQRVLREILATPRLELQAMGRRGAAVLAQGYGKRELQKALCDVLQRGLPAAPRDTGVVSSVPQPGEQRRAA
jgi:hypothetical protein